MNISLWQPTNRSNAKDVLVSHSDMDSSTLWTAILFAFFVVHSQLYVVPKLLLSPTCEIITLLKLHGV